MHPALSVIFFTAVSGLGYGLLFWAAIGALAGVAPRLLLAAIALGLASATAGLLSSLGHLGRPGRAWRALSQWRTSWLSREGVAAVVTYVPAIALGACLLPDAVAPTAQGDPVALAWPAMIVAALLAVLALATVACTAMIYASLKPVPAWTHRSVPGVYLGFSTITGGLAFASLQAWLDTLPTLAALLLAAALLVLAVAKHAYWSAIDAQRLPVSRGDAVGLPDREVRVFERPHTEGNFITREMVFVVARRHASRLRGLALATLAAVPVVVLVPAWLLPATAPVLLPVALASALIGTFVERWLFFAEARHVVSSYY